MFIFTRIVPVFPVLAIAFSSISAEARGGYRGFSGSATVDSYLLRNAANMTAYHARRQRLSTMEPTVAVSELPVTVSPVIAAAPPPVAVAVAAPVVHVKTKEEWQTECKGQGKLVGTSWGFCVVTTGAVASSTP